MTTKTNSKKNINTIGCDNLIDSAFVPGEEREPVLTIADFFDADYKVDKRHPGKPAVGAHKVVLDGEPEVHKDDEGNIYFTFNLMNEDGLCWKTFISKDNLTQTIESISYFNKGMLANKKGMAAINFLQGHSFYCWVLENEKGKALTYFNETKYNKRIFAMSLNAEREEEKKRREKERADREARMAEEAELTRKSREDKAPWED